MGGRERPWEPLALSCSFKCWNHLCTAGSCCPRFVISNPSSWVSELVWSLARLDWPTNGRTPWEPQPSLGAVLGKAKLGEPSLL